MATALSDIMYRRGAIAAGRRDELRSENRARGVGLLTNKLQHEREQRERNKAKHARNWSLGLAAGGAALGAGIGGLAAGGVAGGLTAGQGALVGAGAGAGFGSALGSGDPGYIGSAIDTGIDTYGALQPQRPPRLGRDDFLASLDQMIGSYKAPRAVATPIGDPNDMSFNLNTAFQPIEPVDQGDFFDDGY